METKSALQSSEGHQLHCIEISHLRKTQKQCSNPADGFSNHSLDILTQKKRVCRYDHTIMDSFDISVPIKKPSDSTPLRRPSLRADKAAKSYTRTRTKTRPLNARSKRREMQWYHDFSFSRTLFQLGAVRCGAVRYTLCIHHTPPVTLASPLPRRNALDGIPAIPRPA